MVYRGQDKDTHDGFWNLKNGVLHVKQMVIFLIQVRMFLSIRWML